MKKNIKKMAVIALAGVLAAGSALTANAASIAQGQWSQGTDENAGKWWFKLNAEGTQFLANTWYWIKDTDGVIRCYYFDANGWMATDVTMEDGTVDADGHYVENGVVVTADESKDYATATVFAEATAAVETPASVGTYVVGGGQVGNPDAAGTSSVMVIKAKSGAHKGGGYKTPIKASGLGDSPVNAAFTLPYENASVSGTTVTNNWANYSMNLGKQVQVENTGSGTDWFVEDENAVLINSYIALDKYTAGNTSLDSFISSYMADTRGFKNSSRDGSVNLGAYSFVRLTRTVKTPYGDMYDHAYIRQIEGTNFAQVLVVEQNGDNQDFMGALQTIARVR